MATARVVSRTAGHSAGLVCGAGLPLSTARRSPSFAIRAALAGPQLAAGLSRIGLARRRVALRRVGSIRRCRRRLPARSSLCELAGVGFPAASGAFLARRCARRCARPLAAELGARGALRASTRLPRPRPGPARLCCLGCGIVARLASRRRGCFPILRCAGLRRHRRLAWGRRALGPRLRRCGSDLFRFRQDCPGGRDRFGGRRRRPSRGCVRRSFELPDRDALLDLRLATERGQKSRGALGGELHEGLALLDPDRADRLLVDVAGPADQRQQPARLRPVVAPDRQREPGAAARSRGGPSAPVARRAKPAPPAPTGVSGRDGGTPRRSFSGAWSASSFEAKASCSSVVSSLQTGSASSAPRRGAGSRRP